MQPEKLTKHLPVNVGQSCNSNKTIWSILNRTVFRSSLVEGADSNYLFWLRKSPQRYYAEETEASKALREEFKLTRVYGPDLFYATHKIS